MVAASQDSATALSPGHGARFCLRKKKKRKQKNHLLISFPATITKQPNHSSLTQGEQRAMASAAEGLGKWPAGGLSGDPEAELLKGTMFLRSKDQHHWVIF